MTRIKKSRNTNENGPKRAPRTKKTDRKTARKKQETGNKSGSRQAVGATGSTSGQSNAKKDPRLGSKKPVALSLPTQQAPIAAVKPAKKPALTDEQKLMQLEDDPRLNSLLDQLEEGKTLSNTDQQWLDKQLNEIERLMQKLGIEDLEEANDIGADDEDELLAKFDSGADLLKQYQQDDK
ncbi:aminotransferase [Shewanella mangrovi]|uniref:Der GTPase-activating protein YihI n=1 Tax=Shewanella mangrovi TaxID=1515746 RepID=A0A094JUZ6_9GAMM|nr:Der GTPase-activating protein YihI [Shewanella mangrovi]KFZ36296.1 aminotransferase [Shewanella mangrovi]